MTTPAPEGTPSDLAGALRRQFEQLHVEREAKRLEVLRRIQDVYEHPIGPRIHESMSRSLSVRAEVGMLVQLGLIEPCNRGGESGYRRTAAGDARLAEETR